MADDALLESTDADTDTAAAQADEHMSLAEHAAQFGPQATESAAEPEADPQAPTVQHHSAEQKREADTQRFKDGKKRHRAASQQASPADVPRIQKLTAEKNEMAERIRRYEAQLAAAVAPARQPSAPSAPSAQAKPQAPVADAKPVSSAFENYDDYTDALAKWHAKTELAAFQASQATRIEQTQRQLSVKDADDAFSERMQSVAKDDPEFETVLANNPPKWIHPKDGRVHPDAVMLDAYIRERPQGPRVLKYVLTHPQELTTLLSMRSANGPDVVGQYEALTLLAQRLGSSSSTQAGTTGSAAGRSPRYTPPTPPNPVRTEASAPIVGPPTDDRPMSLTEHYKWFGPNRKR